MRTTDQIVCSQLQHLNLKQHRDKMSNIALEREYILMSMLKPKITVDGDQYCVLYGDNLQDGVAGFGDTVHEAVIDFNYNWNERRTNEIHK